MPQTNATVMKIRLGQISHTISRAMVASPSSVSREATTVSPNSWRNPMVEMLVVTTESK